LIDDLDAKLAGLNSIIDATPDSDAFSSFSNLQAEKSMQDKT
jgi:hypothetical protein